MVLAKTFWNLSWLYSTTAAMRFTERLLLYTQPSPVECCTYSRWMSNAHIGCSHKIAGVVVVF